MTNLQKAFNGYMRRRGLYDKARQREEVTKRDLEKAEDKLINEVKRNGVVLEYQGMKYFVKTSYGYGFKEQININEIDEEGTA